MLVDASPAPDLFLESARSTSRFRRVWFLEFLPLWPFWINHLLIPGAPIILANHYHRSRLIGKIHQLHALFFNYAGSPKGHDQPSVVWWSHEHLRHGPPPPGTILRGLDGWRAEPYLPGF